MSRKHAALRQRTLLPESELDGLRTIWASKQSDDADNPIRRSDYYRGIQKIECLAVSYFHMGKPHTIIGAERFHYRVRDGIGWFPLAIATKQDSKFRESF